MSTLTTNYSFTKAAPTEQYDVSVVNSNLDAIDSAVKANDVAIQARAAALEADSAAVVATMTNAAVWDHVAGHQMRYRKVGKLVHVSGMVQWKSGTLASSTILNLPVGFRPPNPYPEWCTSKASITGNSDVVADFLLDSTGNLTVPGTTYYQGTPVVNIVFPLQFTFFI